MRYGRGKLYFFYELISYDYGKKKFTTGESLKKPRMLDLFLNVRAHLDLAIEP
jgi:hypothetical protein